MIDRVAANRLFFSRVTQSILIVCAAVLVLSYWSAMASASVIDWNAARIYPAFLLAGGISPYATAANGLVTGWIYGPVMPLLHFPATLAPTITSAMLVSAAINLLALTGPMVLILEDAARRAGLSRRERGCTVLASLGLLPVFPVLRDYLVWVHCDQVAIGLTLLSGWFLIRARREPSNLTLGSAAVLAVFAVWTKQIAVMIPLAQLFYLGAWRRDFTGLWRYFIWLLGAGVVVSAAAVFVFGTGPLVFSLWVVPSGHPFRGWAVLLNYAGVFAIHAGVCVGLTVLLARLARNAPVQPAADFQTDLLGLLLVTAACEVPLNLLAACKVGGSSNSFHALPLFFLAMFVAWIAAAGWWRQRILPTQTFLVASASALAGATLLLAANKFHLSLSSRFEVARTIAEQHPGRVYFPQNPLIVWWTERKPQPLEYGLVDLSMAGFPETRSRYFESLPKDLQLVVYPRGQDGAAVQIFPGFKRLNVPGEYDLYGGPLLTTRN